MESRKAGRTPRIGTIAAGVGLAAVTILYTSCADADRASGPGKTASAPLASNAAAEPHAANGDVKAFIGGWLQGEKVQLRYTRQYYCDEPRGASPSTFCEVGTPPIDFPRPGVMPVLYALSPVGISPEASTVHCPGGVVCPNHPPSIDAPPLGDATTNAFAPAHSHIISERTGGWHRTISIRVMNLDVWNKIVANPTIETVRALQADPLYGGAKPALISQNIPTNIFFFIQVPGGTKN